jgi:putative DNA primase/helicase
LGALAPDRLCEGEAVSDFIDFAASYGLRIGDLIADNRWHRCPTESKPRKKNGAYVFDGDRGAVIDFGSMTKAATFRDGARAGFIDRATIRARAALDKAAERARQSEARAKAEDMVKRATLMAHPYLAAKGFPEERGLVLDDQLLIPMREFRHYAQINSLQRISPDGAKLFLPGGKAKGSVFFIGPFVPHERWLVEGYATGLSVRAALRELHRDAQCIVCFSAGNLAHVGRLVKALRPKAYVFADNDKNGAGEKAAEESGLPFVMTSEQGDANDYHQRHGIRALAKLIRETTVQQTAGAA